MIEEYKKIKIRKQLHWHNLKVSTAQPENTMIKITVNLIKLDGVGPVGNIPSTDKLHHFFNKKNASDT